MTVECSPASHLLDRTVPVAADPAHIDLALPASDAVTHLLELQPGHSMPASDSALVALAPAVHALLAVVAAPHIPFVEPIPSPVSPAHPLHAALTVEPAGLRIVREYGPARRFLQQSV